jgi:prepilin signal peptidase PulO-like enzyme (type II secretory pathway)
MSALPLWYWSVFGALLASSVASFLGVVVERLPRGERLGGRSHCACGRQLTVTENVPIFGWLRCRGRTSCCYATLPRWYVLSEASSAALGAFLGALLGVTGLVLTVVTQLLVAAMILRRRHRRTSAPGVDTADDPQP